MTRFPSTPAARRRLPALVLGLLLILSSCGVSRSAPSDAALDGDTVDESASGDETAETPTSTTTPTESTPTPSTAPADDVAVSADFGGGAVWELTHGELNEVVIPTWENQEFITLAFGGVVPPGSTPASPMNISSVRPSTVSWPTSAGRSMTPTPTRRDRACRV